MAAILHTLELDTQYRPSLSNRECERSETFNWVWSRPITFDEFLNLFMGREEIVELIDGTVVEKEMVQLDHEKLLLWLLHVLGLYTKRRELGMVLGSRTATKITDFRGRLPDLLFVRQDQIQIVQQKAVYGAPDVVIEVLSPGDRKSDIVALETDYRTLGVSEIAFIDQKRRRVRLLRKRGSDYDDSELFTGALEFESIPGLALQLDWFFDEPRPDELDLLTRLLAEGNR